MDNIGYALIKKTSNLIIDSNGMFKSMDLKEELNLIINSIIPLEVVGQKIFCFKRLVNEQKRSNETIGCLVILLERVNKNSEDFILGSAICFRDFQVNEDKIINGVKYLLSQLKRNFETDYHLEDKDLGVILPSTNKDFKLFKENKLLNSSAKDNLIGFDEIPFSDDTAVQYLNHFCTNIVLTNLKYLFLVSSTEILNHLRQKGSGYQKINMQSLVSSGKELLESTKLASSAGNGYVEKSKSKININAIVIERDRAQKDKNTYKILTILLSVIAAFFIMSFIVNKTASSRYRVADSSLYPIGDNLYISNDNYNVNIRSTPSLDMRYSNVQDVLSDGDEVFLIGFDKETLWAKISYNEGEATGYVSNRFISKNIDKDRVKPINKFGTMRWFYSKVPLYAFPQESGNEKPETILTYLDEGDKIFIKNEDLRLNWFSIRLQKNNKTYNGFLKRENFNYY